MMVLQSHDENGNIAHHVTYFLLKQLRFSLRVSYNTFNKPPGYIANMVM